MAKKTVAAKAASGGLKKNVENYEHKGAKRLNNPPVGLVNTKTEKAEQKKTYKFDPHLSPQLQWAGKEERSQIELPTVSLHVHERIDPKTIIEAVRSADGLNWEQLNLFNRPINKLSFIKEIQFYQHEKDWTNRLIAGDSSIVMNSLLEKEGLAGKVQLVYFDPPYGIRYGSNFQPFVNKRDVKDGKDSDLSQEPEMIKAFRDTWELGIHSYLTSIRERLFLARRLLAQSGSCIVQIGDQNIHHVRELLDEVFGPENFCNQITFKKTGSQSGDMLASTCDYLLWYAKDKTKVKYRQLYKDKTSIEDRPSIYSWIESPDKSVKRRMTKEEAEGAVPSGWRIFAATPLVSEGSTSTGTFEYEYEGKKYFCGDNQHWKTTRNGLDTLAKKGRLFPVSTSLYYLRYLDDFPVMAYDNNWEDTIAGGYSDTKIYVVQTNKKVVSRCLLMTTDPGDLVVDITCGSGTTPFVCEQYGRRWITCDTSRVAITLAKQRLMTSVFDYYQLQAPDEGISSGFSYQVVPHITLKALANNEPTEEEILYDKPHLDKTKARVSGPFTVEAVPAPVVKELDNENDSATVVRSSSDWLQELLKTGVRITGKEVLRFSRLEPSPATKWIHAEGQTAEEMPQRVVVSFGPDFAPLEQRQVELALLEAEKLKPSPTVIVFAAFQFDPEAAKDIDEIEWGGVTIIKAQMNTDLFTEDLKKKRSSNESFWLVGQPDIDVQRIESGSEKGKFQVRVNGFDYYNTKSGTIESGGASKIAMWLLDSDYDGRSLLPRQVFFPMAGGGEGWAKLAKALKAEIDQDLIEAYRGVESLPFEPGENKKIAIKIIDDRGIESLIVRELE